MSTSDTDISVVSDASMGFMAFSSLRTLLYSLGLKSVGSYSPIEAYNFAVKYTRL